MPRQETNKREAGEESSTGGNRVDAENADNGTGNDAARPDADGGRGELDENGRPFVISTDDTTKFVEIREKETSEPIGKTTDTDENPSDLRGDTALSQNSDVSQCKVSNKGCIKAKEQCEKIRMYFGK